MQAVWTYYPQQYYAPSWPAQSLMCWSTLAQEETLMQKPNCCQQYKRLLLQQRRAIKWTSFYLTSWKLLTWQSPTHKNTSQAGPLWSEGKCQTLDRVLPQPHRTTIGPWSSQIWISRRYTSIYLYILPDALPGIFSRDVIVHSGLENESLQVP